jgi:hypothetical protein
MLILVSFASVILRGTGIKRSPTPAGALKLVRRHSEVRAQQRPRIPTMRHTPHPRHLRLLCSIHRRQFSMDLRIQCPLRRLFVLLNRILPGQAQARRCICFTVC